MLPHGHSATSGDGESYSRNSVAGDISVPPTAANKGSSNLCYGVAILRKEQNKKTPKTPE